MPQVSANPSDTGSPVEHLRAHVFERAVDAEQFDALPADWCSKSGRWSPSKAAVRERAAYVGDLCATLIARSVARRWLRDRPERSIAVITHGSFINILAGARSWSRFDNVEVREYRFRGDDDDEAKLEPFDSAKSGSKRFNLFSSDAPSCGIETRSKAAKRASDPQSVP